MKDNIREDILLILEMLNITQDELAKKICVDKKTISFSENKKTQMTLSNIKKLYDYAFENNIHLNKIKSELYIEENKSKNKILFHGSKGGINGDISSKVGRINNDFGQGFYTGESYEQSASFVSMYDKAYIYILEFDSSNLKCAKFDVDTEWMLAIAYFRGTLNDYKVSKLIKKIIDKVKNADYHVYDGQNWRYLNLPMEDIAPMCIASIKDSTMMYFSCDVGKFLNRDKGLMDMNNYDYESLMGTTFGMDKKQRVATFASGSSHAMTLCAVDLDKDGKPLKWMVENSWGPNYGWQGNLIMTNDWFNEYMFRVVLEEKYIPANIRAMMDQKPILLPAWDPMFALEE